LIVSPQLPSMLAILSILPILLLLVIPGILAVVHLFKPGFRFSWLIMVSTSLLAWLMVMLTRLGLPYRVRLGTWEPAAIFSETLNLKVDETSWPFMLAIASLTLAVLLTAVVRQPAGAARLGAWRGWAACLVMAALGMLAVMVGNLLTLLMAWTALDLVELFIRLAGVSRPADSERVIIGYTSRVISLLLVMVISATALATPLGQGFKFLSSQASLLLLVAAGLRLGALPLNLPLAETRPARRGLDAQISFIPAAAALVVLVQAAPAIETSNLLTVLLILACIAALYGGLAWASARDAFHGQPYWIVGMAGLAILSALVRQSAASLAWGLALLLPGSLVSLYSLPNRRLLPLLALGLMGITALPFTPAWQGVRLYTASGGGRAFEAWWVPALLAQALFVVGYIRHSLQPASSETPPERWIWFVYPWGLALLPLAQIIILIFGIPGLRNDLGAFPSLAQSWPSLASLALAAPLVLWLRSSRRPSERLVAILRKTFSFSWLYRILWAVYRFAGRLGSLGERIFEGDGGILWTILLLTLLLVLLVQIGAGA
jgi:hypothetical protein